MWLLLPLLCAGAATLTDAAPPVVPTPSSWPGPYPGITFKELQPRVRTGSVFLLDVRNRSELLNPGRIPNSLNLPLHELDAALEMSATDFQVLYGFNLPAKEEEMVLVCRSGRRIQVAARKLIPAGWKNLKLYYGSFKDWVKNEAPVSRAVDAAEVRKALTSGGLVLDLAPGESGGRVEGSRAMKLEELATVLRLPKGEFLEKFGFEKPSWKTQLTLLGANRTQTLEAVPLLNKLQYCDLRLYLGSVEELNTTA